MKSILAEFYLAIASITLLLLVKASWIALQEISSIYVDRLNNIAVGFVPTNFLVVIWVMWLARRVPSIKAQTLLRSLALIDVICFLRLFVFAMWF